jgi:hypothetical protein
VCAVASVLEGWGVQRVNQLFGVVAVSRGFREWGWFVIKFAVLVENEGECWAWSVWENGGHIAGGYGKSYAAAWNDACLWVNAWFERGLI